MMKPRTSTIREVALIILFTISTAQAAPWDSSAESCTKQNIYFESLLPEITPETAPEPAPAIAEAPPSDLQDQLDVAAYEASFLNVLYATEKEIVEKASTKVENDLPRVCVDAAISFMPKSYARNSPVQYAVCKSEVQFPARSPYKCNKEFCFVPKPCRTEKMTAWIQRSLVEVSRSAGIHPKELFAVLAFESGGIPNIGNFEGGDMGIAQLTPRGISRINEFVDFSELKSRPECQKLPAEIFAPLKFNGSQCDRLGLTLGMQRSILYAALMYHQGKQLAQVEVEKMNALRTVPLADGVGAALELELTRAFYNADPGMLSYTFERFAAKTKKSKASAKDFVQNFRNYLKSNFAGNLKRFQAPENQERLAQIRQIISTYNKRLTQFGASVTTRSGVDCFSLPEKPVVPEKSIFEADAGPRRFLSE